MLFMMSFVYIPVIRYKPQFEKLGAVIFCSYFQMKKEILLG
ncbi:hypothetical protein ACFSL6_14270 [Paenibacillus thailandensis]|uniref:Uncharacterized protein n=1 Tax=Paenibacillus thailandensis TaxID=393250 RepID=A0ABW5R0Z7_9BACL